MGAVGKLAQNKTRIENIVLSTFGGDDQEFSHRTGLSHISGSSLLSGDQLAGALVLYSYSAVSEDLLLWWRLYSDLSAARLNTVLSSHEKDRRSNQLALLLEATRTLNPRLDLPELLELILKIARTEVKADHGAVFLLDQRRNELRSIATSGSEHQELRTPLGKGVAGRVAQTGEIINSDDVRQLEFFDSTVDACPGCQAGSLLSLPIRQHAGEIVGVLQLLNAQNVQFSADDVAFLTRLSGHIAVALENSRLHRDMMEQQRVQRELALARSIRSRLLPDAPPLVAGYEIAVLSDFCFDMAGDYYDFINLGPHSLLIV